MAALSCPSVISLLLMRSRASFESSMEILSSIALVIIILPFSTLDHRIHGESVQVPRPHQLRAAANAAVARVAVVLEHVVVCVAQKAGQNALSLLSKHLHDLGRLQLGSGHEDFPEAEVEVQGLEPLLLEDRVLEVVRHDQTHADREGPEVPV